MEVQQTRRFARQYKKLPDHIVSDVDAAVDKLTQNPEIGERKKGDLVALRVVKFRSAGQLFLLSYTLDEGVRLVYLESVGPTKISIAICSANRNLTPITP